MKIIRLSGREVTEGVNQSIPFVLGEDGRGRVLTKVEVSSAPGKVPDGPPPVGPEVPYASEPAGRVADQPDDKVADFRVRLVAWDRYKSYEARKRAAETYIYDVDYLVPARPQAGGSVFLLRAGTVRPPQRGVLLRINTAGCYTKGSCGEISPIWGTATEVASGRWAEGGAGRVAGGPDSLYHVPGAAFFRAVLQGGEGKGWGGRCVVVTAAGRCWMGKTVELAALITADERPDLAAVVRQMLAEYQPEKTAESTDYQEVCSCKDASGAARPEYGGYDFEPTPESRVGCARHTPVAKFPEWYQTLLDAVAAAQALEAAPPAEAEGIEHYFTYPVSVSDWPAFLSGLRPALTLPGGQTVPGGVDRVQAGCLMPGPCSMVILSTNSGGKRYRHSDIRVTGVEVIARGGYDGHGYYSAGETILGIVTDPAAFRVEWEEFKDGQQVAAIVAGPDGVRRNGELTPWA